MEAFKSLQAWKYFETKIGVKVVKNCFVLAGKRANLKTRDVWVIVLKGGSISTAHCTFLAGNSENCSHVGAVLFATEYAHSVCGNISCIDVKSTVGASVAPAILKIHAEVIMPELLGRYFTKQAGITQVTSLCKCNGVDGGQPMILCGNDNCQVDWYHLSSVGLEEISDGGI
nr:unnamed protein product [Callosobruchus analis]CAI5845520.1 unnamed protein product [Callosobruchus analis]